jgi:hypothetical protein
MAEQVSMETLMSTLYSGPLSEGKSYKHRKTGRWYTLERLAVMEGDLSPVAVYRKMGGGVCFVRPYAEFIEKFAEPSSK